LYSCVPTQFPGLPWGSPGKQEFVTGLEWPSPRKGSHF
jgi:hypothetical protein